MDYFNLVESFQDFRGHETGEGQCSSVEELRPSDFPAIVAYQSHKVNLSPEVFNFYVPDQSLVVAIRLSGASVLKQHCSGQTTLIRASSACLYAPGKYSMVFGRGLRSTLFLVFQPQLVPGIQLLVDRAAHQLVSSCFDVEEPLIADKLLRICKSGRPQSYFTYAAVLSEALSVLNQPIKLEQYSISRDSIFQQLIQKVEESPNANWNTATAADVCGYSVFHFSRTFRSRTGIGFSDYLNIVRTRTAVEAIFERGESCKRAIAASGFSSEPIANRVLRKELGFTLHELCSLLDNRELRVAS